jgi:hypothetical protein
MKRDVAQLGSAPARDAGGRRFKSGHPDSRCSMQWLEGEDNPILGMWRSLVARSLRMREDVGSNPAIPIEWIDSVLPNRSIESLH